MKMRVIDWEKFCFDSCKNWRGDPNDPETKRKEDLNDYYLYQSCHPIDFFHYYKNPDDDDKDNLDLNIRWSLEFLNGPMASCPDFDLKKLCLNIEYNTLEAYLAYHEELGTEYNILGKFKEPDGLYYYLSTSGCFTGGIRCSGKISFTVSWDLEMLIKLGMTNESRHILLTEVGKIQ